MALESFGASRHWYACIRMPRAKYGSFLGRSSNWFGHRWQVPEWHHDCRNIIAISQARHENAYAPGLLCEPSHLGMPRIQEREIYKCRDRWLGRQSQAKRSLLFVSLFCGKIQGISALLAPPCPSEAPQSDPAPAVDRNSPYGLSGSGVPMLKSIFLGLLLVVCAVTPVAAQSLERAEAAYFRGDYADAMEMMLPLAEEGDRHAQYLIGFMHERGQGVPKDPAKGAEWYGRAAERGNPFAQNNLGVLYKHGRGVSQDYVMAYKWFDLAASGYLPAELGHRERAVLNQQDIVAKMTPEQVSEAQKLAEEFREANAGFADRPPRVR